jgi:hypothetical protein
MLNKVVLILFLIIFYRIIIITCDNYEISYNQVKKFIGKDNNYNYTIGPLPYYNSKYYEDETKRFFKFIDILDKLKHVEYTNLNRYEQNKMSIKIDFFKRNNELNFNLLEKFVKYSNSKNIMVGFAAMTNKDKDEELDTYIRLIKLGYKNIFITLATYRSDINERVDYVLKHNGTVRLVKGWYKDGDIKSWKKVSELYFENARKLIETNNYHILATHDFNILKKLYDIYGEKQMNKIEIIFFSFSKKFVTKKIKNFPYKIQNKSFYKPYGKVCLSFLYTLKNMSIWRDFQRRYIGRVK